MTGQQLKNTILQEAIEGRLVPQDPNDEPASVLLDKIRKEKARLVKEKKIILSKPEKACIIKEDGEFSLPQSWEWGMINDVCRVFGRIGFRGYTKNDLRYSQENAAISISPSNMINGAMDFSNCTYISEEKYEESPEIKIQNGDILIVKTGSSYGKSSLVENLPWKSTINPQIAVVKDIKINKHFLVYFFQSPYAQSKFKNFVLGTSIPTFSQLNLISMQIPLPPLAEQKRIVAKIEELLPKVDEYGKAQEALDKLNEELPERLKKSILQEAIEGRLVPQDHNDEPASVLLDKIRKEKAKLVKEGKLKKKDLEEKPISEDEKPFDIPKGWEWVRLEDITIYISRGKSPVYSETRKYPIVAQKCNQWSGFSLEKAKFADPQTIDKYTEERLLRDGDLLWNSTGLGTLGRMAIYNSAVNQYGWAVADSHVTVIRTRPDFAFYKFLYYYFASPEVQNVIEDKSDGSTKQKELAQETVKKYEIPLPPLAEQKRIVAKIEQLLKVVDKLKV